MPKMAKGATTPELKQAFETHRDETEGQIERLNQIFEMMGKPARGKTCDAILGILDEAKEFMEDFKGTDALDPALVASGQTVEHYEISRYGTLKSWASELGFDDASKLLDETLQEEIKTDKPRTGSWRGAPAAARPTMSQRHDGEARSLRPPGRHRTHGGADGRGPAPRRRLAVRAEVGRLSGAGIARGGRGRSPGQVGQAARSLLPRGSRLARRHPVRPLRPRRRARRRDRTDACRSTPFRRVSTRPRAASPSLPPRRRRRWSCSTSCSHRTEPA